MPKQIIIADSTQIDTFLTCPQMWKYGFNESLELITLGDQENNSQKAIRMGTYGHFWMDKFYSARALDATLSRAVEFANTELEQVDAIDQDPKDNHQFPLNKELRDQVKQRLQQYWMTYSNADFQPACKQIETIVIENGLPIDIIKRQPLVEQGFSYELFNSPEYLFILEGRIDLIATMGNSGQLGFIDHKFQLRERELYNKSIQFKNYALVTGLSFGTINYIRLHKEVSNKTFKRELISFNSAELRSWRSELISIFEMMATAVKHGDYAFLRNRSACPGKFGYPCQFTHICEEPSRNVGNAIKTQMYRKKEEWKPW